MKKEYFLIIPFIFLGLIISFLYQKYKTTKINPVIVEQPFISQGVDYNPGIPKNSIRGKTFELNGTVKKSERNSVDFVDAKSDSEFLIGDDVETDKDSNIKINFVDLINIYVAAETRVSIVDLYPNDFLFNQVAGDVTYTVTDEKSSISVRSLRTLFTLQNGEALVQTDADNKLLVVNMRDGKAKVAFVDEENDTQVYEINSGERALIDNETLKIKIVESL